MGCLKLSYYETERYLPEASPLRISYVNGEVREEKEDTFLGVGDKQTQGSGPQLLQASIWDFLDPGEKHFNGSIGLIGAAIAGYNKIPNEIKRSYAYMLSKLTGLKSGSIFQGVKGFSKSASKFASKAGPIGTLLTVGVIGYEVGTNSWDAHTVVNGSLLVAVGVATFFAAPVVLTGIAAYGIGDYFFDFSGSIDATLGRNSGLWDK